MKPFDDLVVRDVLRATMSAVAEVTRGLDARRIEWSVRGVLLQVSRTELRDRLSSATLTE